MRIVAVLLFVCGLAAADWPQWRGPNRDGIVTGTTPAAWPDKLTRKWNIVIGEGHSSPIAAMGRVFTLSREGDTEVVRALEPASGKVIWQQSYAAPYTMNPAAESHGKGPKSTPVFSSGKLCTFGINGTLSCFDAATGRPLWRNDFKAQFKTTAAGYGTAMSPIVDSGMVIVHAGGNGNGAIEAFDLNSGAQKWYWNGDAPAYASPVVVELQGVRQLVTQTQNNITSLAVATGELLWKIPFRTSYEQNSVTPVVYGQSLILSGLDNGLIALRVNKDGGGFKTERVWENTQAAMYMSTPVISGDVIYGFGHKNKGQLLAVDAKTGATLWSGPPRQGENAAIVRQGQMLYVMKNDADLLVVRANPKSFELVKQYTVADSPTWAHPLVMDDGFVIKDKTSLSFWGWK